MKNGDLRFYDAMGIAVPVLAAIFGMALTMVFLGGNIAGWWTEIMAAWIQAVGVIVAIAVAVMVPWWQHQAQRAEAVRLREIQRQTLAMTITPPVADLLARTRFIHAKHAEFVQEERGGTHITLDRYVHLKIFVGNTLNKAVENLHLLDEAGALLAQAIALTDMYNDRCERGSTAGGAVVSAANMQKLVDRVIDLLERVLKLTQARHDAELS